MTRKGHLDWCKERALALCDEDKFLMAWIGFKHDMGKHEETKNHIALELGDRILAIPAMQMLMQSADGDAIRLMFGGQTRHFIEGFN